ncbi:14617_t:CDS:2 [Cetraspora pellucida]|uniref:14617_t:CDS:1 n=1 Tax=Cetraspora pellucida TaxID=1433469 RepID=A0ACA9MAI5_9GLOM|nr:14617_t:CDS:2 [Cetraspora pellucida]
MFQKKRVVLFLIFLVSHVHSFGFVGHQIAAAIGQRFLSPKAFRNVFELLPKEAHGNLSYIAAWPDQVKHTPEYRFTSPMHFISPPNDYPPNNCTFSWSPGKYDLINAIHNYSNRLDPESDPNFWPRAEALRFLVHFIGDLHQPLHITARDRGGNGSPALFEGHHINLHSIWDSSLIYKRIREFNENSTFDYNLTEIDNQFNSSEPLFGGPFYDLYLGYIIHLMKTTWRQELSSWTICQEDFELSTEFSCSPNQFHFTSTNVSSEYFTVSPMDQNISHSVACPEFWAIQINELNCKVVYNGYEPKLDLSIGTYYERIVDGKIIEKLLAIAGIRIAAVLNTILG